MKFIDIANGVLKGTITIDQNGHDPFYGWGEKLMKEELKKRIARLKEHPLLVKNTLDYDCGPGPLPSDFFDGSSGCAQCGQYMWFVHEPGRKAVKCIGLTLDDKMQGEFHVGPCIHGKMAAMRGTFEARETLVFANFLREQMAIVPDEERRGKYSLNNHAGRLAVFNLHATQNCVCCQVGDGRVYFYINKEQDRLVVLDRNIKSPGWTKLGEISPEMWRWMMVNKSDIKDPKTSIGYNMSFDADIPLGQWDVVNYYGTDEKGPMVNRRRVMTEMRLKK